MRLLAGIILTLFASVWLALSLKQDPGYAMFSIGEWTVETSFAFLLLFLASLCVVLGLFPGIGLALANGLVALTGSLVAQQQGFADVGMGIGTIVAGLAGVIMGEVIFGERSIGWVLFAVIGGSIVYRLLIAVSLRLGIDPTDLKLLTAVLVVVALSIPTIRMRVVRA